MYASILFALLLLPTPTQQAPAPAHSASNVTSQQALTAALLGQWTGVLEYRDYSERATSTKRVQLPLGS